MDGQRFDALTRALALGTSRRRVLRVFGGGAISGLVGLLGAGGAEAATCADRCSRLPVGAGRDQCLDACAAANQSREDADAARAYAQALRDCGGDASRLCGSGTGVTCCTADEVCTGGACVASGSQCPDGQIQCANGCTDVSTDPNNCGVCNLRCSTSVEHASAVCTGGQCGFACTSGFHPCGDACCADGGGCDDGSCNCPPGQEYCGSATGCTELKTDPDNCGFCSIVCGLLDPHPPQMLRACSGGHCGFVCDAGYFVCGDNCCLNGQICSNGECRCPAGQRSCPANGNQCIDITSDPNNCGECEVHCGRFPANGHAICHNSTCGFACDSGFIVCGDRCVPADDPPDNCATCGEGCSGIAQVCCTGVCVDKDSDPENCGSCGSVCETTGGRTCVNGRCGCHGGTTACGSGCADLSTDLANCGACGHACADGQICRNGLCFTPCDNFAQCPGGCSCAVTIIEKNGIVATGPTLCVSNEVEIGRNCAHGAICPAGEICLPSDTQAPNSCVALCGA